MQEAPSPTPPKRKPRTWLRDTVEILVLALVLYVGIWSCLQTVRVDGCSMAATLQNNDLLIASKISYDFGGNPQRGDIVVFPPGPEYCAANDPNCDFIKRVVAVPGDVIEIDGTNPQTGPRILIKPGGGGSFETLNEPYIATPDNLQQPYSCTQTPGGTVNLPQNWNYQDECCLPDGKYSAAPGAVTVPPNEYFVMGDDRNNSEDSRTFGFVHRSQIQSKAILRIWPPFQFGLGPGSTLLPSVAGAVPLLWLGRGMRPRRRRRGRMRRRA